MGSIQLIRGCLRLRDVSVDGATRRNMLGGDYIICICTAKKDHVNPLKNNDSPPGIHIELTHGGLCRCLMSGYMSIMQQHTCTYGYRGYTESYGDILR